VLACGAFGGKAGDADFEDAARFEHFVARKSVQRGEETERLAAEHRRTAADEGAGAVTRLDDTHRGQRAKAGTHAGAADPNLHGKLAFGWKTVAWFELALVDQAADVRDHQFCGDPIKRT
jgi:hypothetical protein